jgi:hypothetical protein
MGAILLHIDRTNFCFQQNKSNRSDLTGFSQFNWKRMRLKTCQVSSEAERLRHLTIQHSKEEVSYATWINR